MSDLTFDILADRLSYALRASGKSKAQLAAHMRVSERTIERWLTGGNISKDLGQIATYVGVNVFWLETGDGPVTSSKHSGNTPGDKSQGSTGKNTHKGESQKASTNSSDDPLDNKASQDANRNSQNPEVDLEVPKGSRVGESVSVVRVPGVIKIKIWGRTYFKLIMSVPDPDWEETVDMTNNIMGLAAEYIPPPQQEKPPAGES